MVKPNNDPGCRQFRVLNLAGFLARSEVNGPGIRAVLWVQGCPRRCEGCFNRAFQPFSPATLISVTTLADTILSLDGIDGVTFSGGEPFAQAGPLAELGAVLRNAGLDVITYTGYTPEELAAGSDPAWPALLAATDLLIAGPYIARLAKPNPLTGSQNQQVIPLGTRFLPDALPDTGSSHTEFTIARDGTVTATGFPEPALIRRIASHCRGT